MGSLRRTVSPPMKGYRVERLMGGDVISALGICDLREGVPQRWEFELNQIQGSPASFLLLSVRTARQS